VVRLTAVVVGGRGGERGDGWRAGTGEQVAPWALANTAPHRHAAAMYAAAAASDKVQPKARCAPSGKDGVGATPTASDTQKRPGDAWAPPRL